MKRIILTLLTFIVAINVITAQSYPKMIKVRGGTLGSITVSDYYISQTEVTVAQYKTYCRATGVSMPKEPRWGWNNSDPIVSVSWNDAIYYCEWLADRLDEDITLPTEAQWEFAARGGNRSNGYKYSGGRSIATTGWYEGNSGGKAHRVAQKRANELGLYDMSGNVYEWCLDWYSSSGKYKVLRGGSWSCDASHCRVAYRGFNIPVGRFYYFGFRVVSL